MKIEIDDKTGLISELDDHSIDTIIIPLTEYPDKLEQILQAVKKTQDSNNSLLKVDKNTGALLTIVGYDLKKIEQNQNIVDTIIGVYKQLKSESFDYGNYLFPTPSDNLRGSDVFQCWIEMIIKNTTGKDIGEFLVMPTIEQAKEKVV